MPPSGAGVKRTLSSRSTASIPWQTDLTPVQLTPWQERPLCKVAIMTKSTKSKTTPGGDPSPESRRHFDATFKQEVVALGKRIGISQAAKEMGGW